MAKKNLVPLAIDASRRKLIKAAGISAATGCLGLSASSLFAAESTRQLKSSPVVTSGDGILDVVIVGAGLAGLTAASDLQKLGNHSFVVLEARNRVGGRTYNHDLGGGQYSDAGGQWIGPGQDAIAELAKELGVATFPTYYDGKTVVLGGDGKLAIDLHGTFGADQDVVAKLNALARDVPSGSPWESKRLAELDKMTLGDWLRQQKVKPENRLDWSIASLLTGGSTPAKTGLLNYLSTIHSGDSDYNRIDSIKNSGQETRFVGGSQLLSIKMAKALGEKVRLSCPVRKISGWNQAIVSLHTDQGVMRARRVIMALHPSLCNQIEFFPPLPEKRAALQRSWPAFAPLRKTAMVYSRPFWRDMGLNGHVLQLGGPIMWAYDNSPPRGEIGVINAFVASGDLPSDPEAAKRISAEVYAKALGPKALNYLSFHDHDWAHADPWAVTCLPAVPPGYWSIHGEALRTPCGNLIWSGTETSEIWVGYMDGAVRSGHSAARQVVGSLLRS